MLTARIVTLALVGFGVVAVAQPEQPYAPDLYSRDALKDDQTVAAELRGLPDSARPFAPDLFLRDALADHDEGEFSNNKRGPFVTPSRFFKRDAVAEDVPAQRGLCRRDVSTDEDSHSSDTRERMLTSLFSSNFLGASHRATAAIHTSAAAAAV